MDALSEVLRVVQLNSAVFFVARFTAPWSFGSPDAASVKDILSPGAEKLVMFHLFTEGECRLEMAGEAPMQVRAGDVVVFPHGDAHHVASGPGIPAGPLPDVRWILGQGLRELQIGGGGAATRCICGFLVCDPRLCRPVLTALPRVLQVNLRKEGEASWVESALHYALSQAAASHPGSEGMLAKLSEVLFVETLRRHIASLPPEQTGWLAGVRDPVVGRALALLHHAPAQAWTVESLARDANTSRSVLAERFTHLVGQSPMQYLGHWRMALAANMLRGSTMGLARVAEEVGYETDAAFSRAFRREFGLPPAAWRRTQVSGSGAAAAVMRAAGATPLNGAVPLPA